MFLPGRQFAHLQQEPSMELAHFEPGAIVIHPGMQNESTASEARAILSNAVASGLDVSSVTSSLTPDGPDLGALHFKRVKPVKVMMITGRGVSEQEAGNTWHHMDQHLGFAPTMVEMHRLARIKLSDYTHLVLADGSYSGIVSGQQKRLTQWVSEGGILISVGRGSSWVESLCFSSNADDCKDAEDKDSEEAVADEPYANYKKR